VRSKLPQAVLGHLSDPARYDCKGSAGQGNWAKTPWVAVFDRLVTTGAQFGYYVVYLFPQDFRGVHLSLNQGVTEVSDRYRSEAKDALAGRAIDFRAQLGTSRNHFSSDIIHLGGAAQDLPSLYESGNVCARYYSADALPDEDVLARDLHLMLELYADLMIGEMAPSPRVAVEDDEPPATRLEDLRRLRLHKRIERNGQLADSVKRAQGYVCQICGLDFARVYGALGIQYIEAHHLTPPADLMGRVIALDPVSDFTVLCANCHCMIHRSDAPGDIAGFRARHYHPHSS
jgi:5-methylcytosine-specific restriction protein A